MSLPGLSGPGSFGKAKLDGVKQLLKTLKTDFSEKTLSDNDRVSKLEQLKVYGRNPQDADPIFTPETVKLLCDYAFSDWSMKTSQEALKVLANTFLIKPNLMDTFLEGFAGKAMELLKDDSDENEFLICRILLLATYRQKLDFPTLVPRHDLAGSMKKHLSRHAKLIASSKDGRIAPPMESMALSENLKLFYNIIHYHGDLIEAFNSCIEPLLEILSDIQIPKPALQPPVTFLLNALAQINLQEPNGDATTPNPLFPESNPKIYIDKFTDILSKAVADHSGEELEEVGVPLVLLLNQIASIAPPAQKQHLQSILLPTPADRDLPIGQSSSTSSQLLRLTTKPAIPNLQKSISAMYFELSDRNPTTFVKNIGYGYAAGFLMSNNIPVPSDATATSEDSNANDIPINPITGQRLDREPEVDTGPEMTEEEKEREAERLFVLFERLKATGVVNVENPVTQAMRQAQESGGRIQELADSDSD